MAQVEDPRAQRANRDFIQASMRAPMLSREHEHALAVRWREAADERALHALAASYTRLVIAMASRFKGYGLPLGDLIQEGNVGLMQAAGRFEPQREIRFSTYAAWWIRAAMQDFVLRNWSVVRTGTTAAQRTLFFNLRRQRARIERASGRPLDDADRRSLADQLGVPLAELEAMERRLAATDQSLSVAAGPDAAAWDRLADERPNPEAAVIDRRDATTRTRWLVEALGALNPRERQIIDQRRLRDQGATLEALGRALGISKERVRQLETRALSKLKRTMVALAGDPRDLFPEI
jgi:RNA polymerase sigma-32 factor